MTTKKTYDYKAAGVGLSPTALPERGAAQYSDDVAFNGVSNNLYGLRYKTGESSPNAANQTTLSPASPTLPVQEAGYTSLSQANSALRKLAPSSTVEGAKQILNKATNKYIADNNLSPNQLGNGQRLISPEMAAQYAAVDYAASSGGGGGGGNSGVATPDYSAYYAALSNMMSGAPGMSDYGDISKYGGYNGTAPTFQQSAASLAAAAALAQQEANKPGAYQSKYQQQLDAITDEILGRGKFRYDFNADPQYQAYRDRYVQQAQEGMRDSMGQAAALTGGYGSSYGQQVGQQTYQGYMDALNDMIPTLRNQAYQEWLNEGEQAYNQANLLRGLEDTNYGRYRDTVSDWQNERNYLADRENLLWNRGYGQFRDQRSDFESDRGYDFNLNQFNTGIDQDNRNFRASRDDADFDRWFKQQQLQLDYAQMAMNAAKNGLPMPTFSAYPGASGGSSIAGAVAGTVGASGGSSGGSSSKSSSGSSSRSSSSSSKSSTKNIVNAVNQAYQNGASWAEIYSGLAQDLASGAISQDQYTAAYKAAVAGAKKR